MRLLINFLPLIQTKYDKINKYNIQGFIYSLLKNNLEFKELHNLKGFKFFNFSNIFPIGDFEKDSLKKIIISSPDVNFIKTIYQELKNKEYFMLNKYKMEIMKVKLLNDNFSKNVITATPIVLYENNKNNRYYSFKSKPDFNFFFERLKDNAIKKYNAFYQKDFVLDDNLFSTFEYNKEVSIRLKKDGNQFIIIGSLWRNLEFNVNKSNKNFYKFLYDVGLGEKNSLGFGFLNNRR